MKIKQLNENTMEIEPFIYNDEYFITNPKLDETGRFLVPESHYKEELKNFDF